MDEDGGGFLHGAKRLVWFTLALAVGALIGDVSRTLPEGVFSFLSGGEIHVEVHNLIDLMLACALSAAMPVFLGLVVLAAINWRLFWVLAATVATGTATILAHDPRPQAIAAGAILLGIVALGFWWFWLFQRKRATRERASSGESLAEEQD